LGKVVYDLLHTKFSTPLSDIVDELKRSGHWEGELRHTRADGGERVVSTRWAIQQGKVDAPVILEINSDITDRALSEQSLRELSTYLMTVQDEERRRIARELHDSTGQKLVAVKMNLETAASEADSKGKTRQAVREGVQLVDDAIRDIRTLAQLLHPPLLDEAGLISATRWLIEGFEKRGKIPLEFKAPRELPRLPENVEIALFRIVQEALTNIYRHSGASKASVELLQKGDEIELRIQDNGKGVDHDVSAGKARVGVGILGMKERMSQLGGSLDIEAHNPGTLVRASLRMANVKSRPSKASS
jgi:signal transduction histidine kinase